MEMSLDSVVGFGGQEGGGLLVHPDGRTILYPLGCNVVIRPKDDMKSQEFLKGHSDRVTCLALSKSGNLLASGQITYMGFTADVILWDFPNRQMLHRLSLHKVKVQALSFSCDDRYLASLGGVDDNSLVVWDVQEGEPVCGSPTDNDHTTAVKFFNTTSYKLVTGGNYNLNVWDFDHHNRKIRPQAIHMGQLRRVFNVIAVDDLDEYAYCGTASGDVVQVSLPQKLFKASSPFSNAMSQGVTATCIAPDGMVITGGGDGSLMILRPPAVDAAGPYKTGASKKSSSCKVISQTKLRGSITSIGIEGWGKDGYSFVCGTSMCEIWLVSVTRDQFVSAELIQSCHSCKINDIVFPKYYSEVFATCSMTDIRIWHLQQCREMLRIQVPNVECNCITFTEDGKGILSGWSDGKIRAFGPQSGKLMYVIHDAHHQGVTAIASTSTSDVVVSGGGEGSVRVWKVGPESRVMLASMKEHKSAVNCIKLRKNDEECASASSDGSCIMWDLKRYKRISAMFASTFFKSVAYHPDESQLVTLGTDRKISYWDAYDGQEIRVLDGSDTDALNSVDISQDGQVVVSGAADKLVKLWGYDEGHCYMVGKGHSGSVSCAKISPNMEKIVSVGAEGAIFIWDYEGLPRGD